MFGKTQQVSVSTSYQKSDVNISESSRMEQLVPASKIATLSQGNFVGKVADNFGEDIDRKLFNGFIPVETGQMRHSYQALPDKGVSEARVKQNFDAVKKDIEDLLRWEQNGGLI